MRVSTNCGGAYDSSANANAYAYAYAYAYMNWHDDNGGSGNTNSAGDTKIILNTSGSMSSTKPYSDRLTMYALNSTVQKNFTGHFSGINTGPNFGFVIHGSTYLASTSAINAVQFLMSSGNFSGTIEIYGIP